MKGAKGARNAIARLVAFTALLCGCAAVRGGQPPPRDPQYNWGFYNAAARPLDEVAVHYTAEGGTPASPHAGWLTPGNYKCRQFAPGPIPEKATVSWKTDDGRQHEQVVEVAKKVADLKRFKGTIYIYFTDDGPQVISMTSAEQDEEAEQGLAASLAARAGGAAKATAEAPAAQPTSRPAAAPKDNGG